MPRGDGFDLFVCLDFDQVTVRILQQELDVLAGLTQKAMLDFGFGGKLVGEDACSDIMPAIPAQGRAEVPNAARFARMHLAGLIVQCQLMAEQDYIHPLRAGPPKARSEALAIELGGSLERADGKR